MMGIITNISQNPAPDLSHQSAAGIAYSKPVGVTKVIPRRVVGRQLVFLMDSCMKRLVFVPWFK